MPKILYESQSKYLSSLRIQPDDLIQEMENYAAEKRIPILDWNAAEFLEQIILIREPQKILEIGTAIAYSAIRMARTLKNKATLDTIEKSKNNIKLAIEYIKRAKSESIINILEGDALEIMPTLEGHYDLIFLDADKEDYERLFHYSLMLLKKSGVLFVDNLLWHGHPASKSVPKSFRRSTKFIREFNKLFVNQPNLNASIYPIGDGVGLGVKV
jgi:predicted O-methyltransferase YrrM